jgi:hypothetical protein
VGVIYRLIILVSADVSQPIQKIIGIGYLMSANTINYIFGIDCTMSADTNNVSGIRGVTLRRREILITVKFWFAPSGCPSFPPSTPPPPSMPHHRHRLPRCLCRLPQRRAVPTFGLDAAGSAAVIVPDLRHRLRPRRTILNPVVPTLLPTPPLASTPPAVPPSSSPILPPSTPCHRRHLPRCLCRLPRRRAVASTLSPTPPSALMPPAMPPSPTLV